MANNSELGQNEKGQAGMVALDKLKDLRVSFKVGSLLALVAGMYYVGTFANAQYVHWHDTRYAKRSEIFTLAQADELRDNMKKTTSSVEKNTETLRSISVQQQQLSEDFSTYAASSLVSQAKAALSSHRRNQDDHSDMRRWEEDKRILESRVEQAEEYRDCVVRGDHNCGRFLLAPQ